MLINIRRSNPLPYHYVWYCLNSQESAFRGNVFTPADLQPDAEEVINFPDGSLFVHLRKPELRRVVNGQVFADFLVSPICEEGKELYQEFKTTNRAFRKFKAFTPGYRAMLKHAETCPRCRGLVTVFNYPIFNEEETNGPEKESILGLANCW